MKPHRRYSKEFSYPNQNCPKTWSQMNFFYLVGIDASNLPKIVSEQAYFRHREGACTSRNILKRLMWQRCTI